MPNQRLIAVVDDDASFRVALVDLLSSAGYCARGFASGEEFLALSASDSYGCVITDIHMPGMSGIELARLLASRGCRTSIIMITGRTDARLERLTIASGAICLLTKPFGEQALIGCLEKALDSH